MDYKKLAERLLPGIDKTPEYFENLYPERNLPEGAKVTRIAPSPTGFIHLGNLFCALANERLAHQSGGVFFLRIEDTDLKRKVDGAVEAVISAMKYFDINFDEGAEVEGNNTYAPFYQRQRKEIYQTYAKSLIEKGLAYPCFCTEEELASIRDKQTENKENPGYYGKYASCRNLTEEEIYKNLDEGKSYVIRLKSGGNVENQFPFTDAIKGTVTVTENDLDVIILKSDGIPTYHFAHVVDDHLMHTTIVVRGEEWLGTLPIHLELFKVLGLKPPKYGHTCQLMKIDNGKKRKLSKRKDPELSLSYYREQGYHKTAVKNYLLTLLNSNFEDWLAQNAGKDSSEFKFSIAKMGKAGTLFDLDKLNNVSKNTLATLSVDQMYEFLKTWAFEFGTEKDQSYFEDKEKLLNILTLCMGANSKKRRKDFITAKQALSMIDYFYTLSEVSFEESPLSKEACRDILESFAEWYDSSLDSKEWFEKVKEYSSAHNFATDMSDYKQNPEKYAGSVSHVAEVIRIAVTGLSNTPDLHTIMQIIGYDETIARTKNAIKTL